MTFPADGVEAHRCLPEIEIVFADLSSCGALLEAQELSTPRLSRGDHVWLARLSGDERGYATWRACRIATRIVIERWIGASFRGQEFAVASGGKPELPSAPPYFSVSHSGDGVVIAVSRSSAIGIDLEAPRSIPMSDDRRRKVASAAAGLADACVVSDDISDAAIRLYWVRLEAAAKVRGAGIGRVLTETGVVGNAEARTNDRDQKQSVVKDLHVRDLKVPGEFCAAIAAARLLPDVLSVTTFPTDAAALSRFISGA